MIPPVQVSPLIKFTRYSALLVGMIYGKKRYDYLKPIAEEERRIEAEEKKKREELERIAKELAEGGSSGRIAYPPWDTVHPKAAVDQSQRFWTTASVHSSLGSAITSVAVEVNFTCGVSHVRTAEGSLLGSGLLLFSFPPYNAAAAACFLLSLGLFL
uniref:ATP synthase F(0) complex subunit e, mitochondrial n=1 Tax=Pavo cristatus TaxID=9049 RepID=A0A8C9FYI8_PAVCR